MTDKGERSRFDSNRHLELLRNTAEAFQQLEQGLDRAVRIGLENLLEELDCDNIHVYFYHDVIHSLECSQAIGREKGIVVGEGRLPVTDSKEDRVSQVYLGKADHALWDNDTNICVPIRKAKEIIGVILVNMGMTKKLVAQDISQLMDFANEFGLGVYNFRNYLNSERQRSRFLTFSKIWIAMASTMKYDDILSVILRSVIAELKFDRVKLYLISKEESLLKGKLVADARGVFQTIEQEKYPLQEGVNRTVDAVLGKQLPAEEESKISKLILNVPLEVKGNKIGVMVVENIFSQTLISAEDWENIKIFANQAALTIENVQLFQKIEELSIQDGLTGVYVFRYLKQRLDEEVARADRFNENLTFMIVDLDDFKKFNDTYGHPFGDKVLQEFAKALSKNVRGIDLVGRYGGDEFVVIFPRLTQFKAMDVGLRILRAICGRSYSIGDKSISFTVSIGMATFPGDATSKEELVKKADEALYSAKQHGKNQVCLASELRG